MEEKLFNFTLNITILKKYRLNNMKEIKIPNKTIDDYLHQIFVKGAAGSVPAFGSLFKEIFTMIIPSSLEERRQIWMEEITSAINYLFQKDENFIENIRENEEFTSIIIEATQFALKSHQDEKIKLFRNAIIGSVAIDTSFYFKQTFLRLIDELHPEQIIILNILKNEKEKIIMLESYDDFNSFFLNHENLKKITPILTRHFLLDLDKRGLIIISSSIGELKGYIKEYSTIVEGNNESLPFISITDLGLDFLRFILYGNNIIGEK